MRVETHVHIGKARKGESACLSVRDLPNGKVRYSGTLVLRNASFAVQPAGLRRFRESGQKNVHAFVRGDWAMELPFASRTIDVSSREFTEHWAEVSYNPAKNDSFVIKETGQTVTTANRVLLVGKRVWLYIDGGWA